jgi:hypothetical protein
LQVLENDATIFFQRGDANETIAHPEGTELSCAAMLSGHDISTRRIEVTNDYGLVLLAIPFTDAYTSEI